MYIACINWQSKIVVNRPYRLSLFTQWPRFRVKYLLMFCALVELKNYFVTEPKNSKKQIRPGKHGNIIFICP